MRFIHSYGKQTHVSAGTGIKRELKQGESYLQLVFENSTEALKATVQVSDDGVNYTAAESKFLVVDNNVMLYVGSAPYVKVNKDVIALSTLDRNPENVYPTLVSAELTSGVAGRLVFNQPITFDGDPTRFCVITVLKNNPPTVSITAVVISADGLTVTLTVASSANLDKADKYSMILPADTVYGKMPNRRIVTELGTW